MIIKHDSYPYIFYQSISQGQGGSGANSQKSMGEGWVHSGQKKILKGNSNLGEGGVGPNPIRPKYDLESLPLFTFIAVPNKENIHTYGQFSDQSVCRLSKNNRRILIYQSGLN